MARLPGRAYSWRAGEGPERSHRLGWLKLTEPVGRPVPAALSETVAVQVPAWLITTEPGQLTTVEVRAC